MTAARRGALRYDHAMGDPPWILRMVEEQFHRDTDDRPLRECRTPAAYLRPGDIQHKPCPYPGARFQHPLPMNVSALRQVSAHWHDIVDALALLRVLHTAQRGPVAADPLDLWRVSQLGSALPWFYILRHGETAPAYAASLAKACQGVGLWAQRLVVGQITGTPPPAFTAEALIASTEASGTLIGQLEVCAGSEPMVRRFFETMLAGEPSVQSAPIQRLAAESDELMIFGAHYAGFKLLLWILGLARQFVYADLVVALGDAHPSTAALRELIDGAIEPPDFVMVRPPDPASVPRHLRAAWLGGLAQHVVPIAPDRSDRALQAAALEAALASGTADAPAALVAEVATTSGLAADAAALAARALATYARLDALLGEVATTVERGFRGTRDGGVLEAAARDRLLVRSPRPLLAALAPTALAAVCPP